MGFSFYRVEAEYCDFLRQEDPHVPYTMEHKARRPFIGLVLAVGGLRYYAPLSSRKPKHEAMKDRIDFLRINRGQWGAINFNNMIPVHANSLIKVDMKIHEADPDAEKKYKKLLSSQLSWCVAHRGEILKRAATLYDVVARGAAYPALLARCCDFKLNEARYLEYCRLKSWAATPLA